MFFLFFCMSIDCFGFPLDSSSFHTSCVVEPLAGNQVRFNKQEGLFDFSVAWISFLSLYLNSVSFAVILSLFKASKEKVSGAQGNKMWVSQSSGLVFVSGPRRGISC